MQDLFQRYVETENDMEWDPWEVEWGEGRSQHLVKKSHSIHTAHHHRLEISWAGLFDFWHAAVATLFTTVPEPLALGGLLAKAPFDVHLKQISFSLALVGKTPLNVSSASLTAKNGISAQTRLPASVW